MSSGISAARWLSAMVRATNELAQTTFNSPPSEPQPLAALPSDREGSLLPLYVGNEAVHVGVLSSPEACRALAKALLGSSDEEELEQAEIHDAVGEIINIIAGIVQRTVDREDGKAVALGYPERFLGSLTLAPNAETLAARMNLGPAQAEVVVIRARTTIPTT